MTKAEYVKTLKKYSNKESLLLAISAHDCGEVEGLKKAIDLAEQLDEPSNELYEIKVKYKELQDEFNEYRHSVNTSILSNRTWVVEKGNQYVEYTHDMYSQVFCSDYNDAEHFGESEARSIAQMNNGKAIQIIESMGASFDFTN